MKNKKYGDGRGVRKLRSRFLQFSVVLYMWKNAKNRKNYRNYKNRYCEDRSIPARNLRNLPFGSPYILTLSTSSVRVENASLSSPKSSLCFCRNFTFFFSYCYYENSNSHTTYDKERDNIAFIGTEHYHYKAQYNKQS